MIIYIDIGIAMIYGGIFALFIVLYFFITGY
jgi:hypothetical protein